MNDFIEIIRGKSVIALYDYKYLSGVLYVAQDSTLNPLEMEGIQELSRRALYKRGWKEEEVHHLELNEDYTVTVKEGDK